MTKDNQAKLTHLIKTSNRILIFTGAGISTGSGIPDFRGPQGIWKRRNSVYYQQFLESEESRIEHWDYKLEGYEGFRDAKPNAAHMAIVKLEKMGKLKALVTQNIDGLHETAGNSKDKIIELHGTNKWIECIDCKKRLEPGPVFREYKNARKPPKCSCGGFLKSATIMFGQAMPQDKLHSAFEAANSADLVMSIGSTLKWNLPRQCQWLRA
ncbi:NAD-dependent deacetylase [Elusimicrobiota bacterium]